jgi:hypothetical protein
MTVVTLAFARCLQLFKWHMLAQKFMDLLMLVVAGVALVIAGVKLLWACAYILPMRRHAHTKRPKPARPLERIIELDETWAGEWILHATYDGIQQAAVVLGDLREKNGIRILS